MEVYAGENSSGEKLFRDNTEEGQTYSFELGPEGMYIKSGYAPATVITVNGEVVTDGKTTNRIRLDRVEGSSTDQSNTAGEDESSDSNE